MGSERQDARHPIDRLMEEPELTCRNPLHAHGTTSEIVSEKHPGNRACRRNHRLSPRPQAASRTEKHYVVLGWPHGAPGKNRHGMAAGKPLLAPRRTPASLRPRVEPSRISLVRHENQISREPPAGRDRRGGQSRHDRLPQDQKEAGSLVRLPESVKALLISIFNLTGEGQ